MQAEAVRGEDRDEAVSSYEVDAATMCDALSHVPGVEHVVLEFDEQGGGVLRVQVAREKDQGVVVDAAVRQLRHRFGLGVDDRRLRLTGPTGRPVVAVVETLPAGDEPAPQRVEAASEPAPALASVPLAAPEQVPVTPVVQEVSHPGSARVVVERVVVSTERSLACASVQLRSGETLHQGSATRPAAGAGIHRALAAATASAVEAVISSSARLDVEQVDLLQVGTDHVAVVVLTLMGASGIDRLTGSALVRSDSRDAVVRATLDALNRRAGLAGVR